jgi:hypothetical protein
MDAFTAGAALIQHLHRSSQSRILIDLPEDNEPSQEQGVSESAPEPEEKGSQDSDPTASRPDVPKLDLGSVRIEALWFDDDVKDAGEDMVPDLCKRTNLQARWDVGGLGEISTFESTCLC